MGYNRPSDVRTEQHGDVIYTIARIDGIDYLVNEQNIEERGGKPSGKPMPSPKPTTPGSIPSEGTTESGKPFKRKFSGRGEYEEYHKGHHGRQTQQEQARAEQKFEQEKVDHKVTKVLESTLKQNLSSRYRGGKIRGKLNQKTLVKYRTSKALYKSKDRVSGLDYTVSILVDVSGSMHGEKALAAAQTVNNISHSLEKLGIEYRVIAFNLHVFNLKEFSQGERFKFVYSNIATMCVGINPGHGENNDYSALKYTYETMPEGKNNILIMISDGQPANGRGGQIISKIYDNQMYDESKDYETEYLDDEKDFRKLSLKHNQVKSFSIGIMGGGWQLPNNTVVHRIADLAPRLQTLLTRKIKRL